MSNILTRQWNPFSHLGHTKTYPFSHFLGSSLTERIKDTFTTFWGTGTGEASFGNLGILGYLLPVFLLSAPLYMIADTLYQFQRDTTNSRAKAISIALFPTILIVAFVLQGFKAIVAGALTLAVSPFILLAHAFSSLFSLGWKNDIQQLPVLKLENPDHFDDTELERDPVNTTKRFTSAPKEVTTLGALLKDRHEKITVLPINEGAILLFCFHKNIHGMMGKTPALLLSILTQQQRPG